MIIITHVTQKQTWVHIQSNIYYFAGTFNIQFCRKIWKERHITLANVVLNCWVRNAGLYANMDRRRGDLAKYCVATSQCNFRALCLVNKQIVSLRPIYPTPKHTYAPRCGKPSSNRKINANNQHVVPQSVCNHPKTKCPKWAHEVSSVC